MYENEKLHTVATDTLFKLLPDYLNKSEHSDWNFEAVIGHLEEIVSHGNNSDLHGNEHQHTEDHLSHSDTHSSVSVSETDKKKVCKFNDSLLDTVFFSYVFVLRKETKLYIYL